MHQVLTPAEIAAKGLTRRDVEKLLKSTEGRVNFYCKQYQANGFKCSPAIQKAWDAECAKWDHLKATLAQWQ